MIPWILMIIGAVAVLVGGFGLLSLYIYLPIKEKFEIVYDRDKEFIKARLDSETQSVVTYHKKQLQTLFLSSFLLGWMMFLSGFYLGYAAQGEGFWLYQKLYPQASANQVWDELNDEGQFVAESGKAYTYYIVISGKEISLCGEPCADYNDLKEKLTQIRKENTVMIIDSFAVSSTYHSVESILNELGLSYEETR